MKKAGAQTNVKDRTGLPLIKAIGDAKMLMFFFKYFFFFFGCAHGACLEGA